MVEKYIIDNIIDTFETELSDRNYTYEHYSVSDIVTKSIERKGNLIDMLRNHPNWDEEHLMIRFDADYSRKFEEKSVWKFADWLGERINLNTIEGTHERKVGQAIMKLLYDHISNQFFNEKMDDILKELNDLNPEFHLRNNMKSSKAIGKICKEMGYDKVEFAGTYVKHDGIEGNDYERRYAELCDNLNPIKVKRHTVISLNPVDYLLMSHGTSWKSCHYIGDASGEAGCYSSGTISYMLDSTSFIFYTVDADWDGEDIETARKIQRQVFGYEDEVFVQSRLYPQSMDSGCEHIYTEIRVIVQKVIADCLGQPNLWIKSSDNVNDIVEKGDDSTCYPDWEGNNPGASHCSISRLKMRPREKAMPKIILGAQPICITCGNPHTYDENISCCVDGKTICDECGYRGYQDDMYYCEDDGNTYCGECCFYCEHCGYYYPNSKEVTVQKWGRNGNYDMSYCPDCANENAYKCDDCGKYFGEIDFLRDFGDLSDRLICEECSSNYYSCYECGFLIEDGDEVEVEDEYYCKDCAEKNEACECDLCGNNFFKSNMFHMWDDEDIFVCEDCNNKEMEACENCGCSVKSEDAIVIEEIIYCPNCAKEVDENKDSLDETEESCLTLQ